MDEGSGFFRRGLSPGDTSDTLEEPAKRAKLDDNEPRRIKTEPTENPNFITHQETQATTYDSLIQLHKALCTVYTFFSTRPHFLATFDSIAKHLGKQIQRDVRHIDIARLKCIIPQDLLFGYVVIDPEDVMELKDSNAVQDEAVLLIEFVDGKLQPAGKKELRSIQSSSPLSSAQWQNLRLPQYGIKTVQKLIQKRLTRFEDGLAKYMKVHGDQWLQTLEEEATTYVPALMVEDDTADPVEQMVNTSHDRKAETPTHSEVDIPRFINEMKRSEEYTGQIVEGGEFTIPEQEPIFQDLDNALPMELQEALNDHFNPNQEENTAPVRLYSHQAEAINQLDAGFNVVVATSTSSGKSLIYQLPILRALLEYHNNYQHGMSPPTAIFIFPTKALAQDQMRSFNSLKYLVFDGITAASITAETYDGDTPYEDRLRIQQTASLIFTNPDMLHANIIPNWENPNWKKFLGGLKYVVVDELHMYVGAFGAHVGYVMRRLRRVHEHCIKDDEKEFQVVSCSATINEPAQVSTSSFEYYCFPANNTVDERHLRNTYRDH